MAFTSVACDIIIEQHPDAWMLDPIVGYVFGVFFGLYGIWLAIPVHSPLHVLDIELLLCCIVYRTESSAEVANQRAG